MIEAAANERDYTARQRLMWRAAARAFKSPKEVATASVAELCGAAALNHD